MISAAAAGWTSHIWHVGAVRSPPAVTRLLWNAIWSDMYIESTFMRYGHCAGGIIGITLKPSALKKWAFSMHICSKLEEDVTEMTSGNKEMEVTTHKEEKPSQIRADNQDRAKIKDKLQLSIDPWSLRPSRWHSQCGDWTNRSCCSKRGECLRNRNITDDNFWGFTAQRIQWTH